MFCEHTVQRAVLTALAVCCVLTVSTAAAEPVTANHTFEVAPEFSWIKYAEPKFMEEEGWMYGIGGSYIYHGPLFCPDESAMLRGDFRYGEGEVDYEGALMDGTWYTIDGVDDYTWEARGLLGGDFTNEIARVTPFSGIGFRYLNDDSSFDPAGYERESHYIYVPFGLEVLFASQGEWTFGGIIEYDWLVYGKQESHLGGSFGTIENRQEKGDGLKASVRLLQQGKAINFGIEPFVRWWNIDDSEVSDGFFEPKNRSVEVGLKLIFQF